ADSARVGVVEEVSAADGRGGEGLPRLEPRLDERFDLPREVVGPEGSATEVRPRRNPDAGAVGQADALDRPFPSSGDALLPLVADKSRDRRGRRKGSPRTEDRQRADEEHLLASHRRDRIDVEARLQDAAVRDPSAGDPNLRPGRIGPPPLPHLEGEGLLPTIARVRRGRRPDVSGPTDTRTGEQVAVVLRDSEQLLRRIE